MTKHLGIFALVLGLGLPVFAAQGSFVNIHEQYQSIRAIGMGGAFAAVADDTTALFYNSAAYARFSEGQVQLSLLDLAASLNFQNFYNQVSGLSGQGSSNIAAVVNTLQGLYGNQYQARIKLLEAAWARPHWGIAFVPADFTLDMAVHNQGAPALDVRAYADTTFAYGYGKNIKNETLGLLSWGITTKAIMREYASKEMNALDVATNSNIVSSQDASNGFTADIDLGLLFTPYLPQGAGWDWIRGSRPTFALVGRNLLDEGFSTRVLSSGFSTVNQPDQLYRVFDLGSRFEIPKFWIFGGRFAFDERDIGHPLWDWQKGLHAGFEFDWMMTSWWKGQWRVGYGGGYPSAGFSALFTVFRLDLAYYGENVGSINNPQSNQMVELRMTAEL
jgi:hypothetical protein